MWLELFKKDWKEGLLRFAIMAGILTVIFLLFYIIMQTRETPFMFLGLLGIMLLLMFFLFIHILAGLHKEWNSGSHHFWLNLPVPGWKLLSAKLSAVFTQFFILLIYTVFVTWFFILRGQQYTSALTESGIPAEPVMELARMIYTGFAPWMVLLISHGALHLGLAAVFIFLMAKSFKPFGWAAGIILALTAASFYSWLSDRPFYTAVTNWGLITEGYTVSERIQVLLTDIVPELPAEEIFVFPVYTGHIVSELIIITGVFFLVVWLLDYKAEA